MVETEKKYRLPSERSELVTKALEKAGAVYEGEELEENTIYGGGPLPSGGIVRIRRTAARTMLTFKRRINNESDVKRQIEHETEVTDPEAVDRIMRELGLRPSVVYEKRRKTWRMQRVEVVIDELPFGLFMEIEGPVSAIRAAEIALGIQELEPEHETYPMLALRRGALIDDVMQARFASP